MPEIFYRVGRWVLLVVLLALAIFFLYTKVFLVYSPKVVDVDARLPAAFHSSPTAFWTWLLGSMTVAGGLGYWSWRRDRELRRGPVAVLDEPEPADPSLAHAWGSIANLRRGHERKPIFLVIAEGDEPASLIAAAGLGPDAVGPSEAATIRGYMTGQGLFIRCGGSVADEVRFVCRTLEAMPETPPLRGIVVLISVATLVSSKSRAWGQAARAGLQAVADSSATRCPAYVVVSGMEGTSGFLEFARRCPEEYRTSARFGFSMPGGENPPPDSLAREYDRLIDWSDRSAFDLMEAGPLLLEGNEALFSFVRWFRRARGPILDFLEAAIPVGEDPPEILGCYFAATGDSPEGRAFAESLVRIKVAGDEHSARWSRQTLAVDARLRRSAIILGVAGGCGAGLAWALIFHLLRPNGWLDLALAPAIALGWTIAWWMAIRGARRGRSGS